MSVALYDFHSATKHGCRIGKTFNIRKVFKTKNYTSLSYKELNDEDISTERDEQLILLMVIDTFVYNAHIVLERTSSRIFNTALSIWPRDVGWLTI